MKRVVTPANYIGKELRSHFNKTRQQKLIIKNYKKKETPKVIIRKTNQSIQQLVGKED